MISCVHPKFDTILESDDLHHLAPSRASEPNKCPATLCTKLSYFDNVHELKLNSYLNKKLYGFYKTTTKQQQKFWLWLVTRVSLKPKQDIKMDIVRPIQVQLSQNLKHLRLSACSLDANKKIKKYFVLKYTCFI